MSDNKNLWIETINLLEKNGRTWEDVTDVFVTGKYNIGKEKFYKLASSANYKEGCDEINAELVIKGKDYVIDVTDYDCYLTYLHFTDLKVPEITTDEPKLFRMFNHEYVGD